MPANDNAIPTSVFTRTENPNQTNGATSKSKSNSRLVSLNTIRSVRSLERSAGDRRMSSIEEGRVDAEVPGEKKMDEILSCLEGTLQPSAEGHRFEVDDEDRVVDLWHLRHLALSRGGLMSPTLRRRAWPKLVGVDEHILTTTSASLPSILASSGSSVTSNPDLEDEDQHESESTVELTNKDIKVVKQDIGRCVWHVEYHIKMLRKQREKKGGDQSALKDIESTLANFSTISSTSSPNPGDSVESPENGKPENRSKREMGLILNIITAVLRSIPEGEDNSRLHYFQGLHDVAALFLINLESPSLTSLVMKRLCHLHFRDAMRPNFQKVQIILQAVIMPLLEVVDRELHDYIIQGGTDDSSVFALSWILTWFAHDVHNFDVVSRLFDVFLVSHPLFPAYLSVGLLTHPVNRQAIMRTNCEFSALYETICELPKKMASNPDEAEVMNQFEDCIQVSLTYIRDSPPSTVITLGREYRGGYLKEFLLAAPSVFLLEAPPRWSIAPTVPTDWSLLKLAKLMRGQTAEARLARQRCLRLRHFVEKIDLSSDEHEIALVALGLGKTKKERSSRLRRANKFVGIVLVIGVLYSHEYYRGPSPISKVLPSTSLIEVAGRTLKRVVASHTQDKNRIVAHTILPSDNLIDRKQTTVKNSVKEHDIKSVTTLPTTLEDFDKQFRQIEKELEELEKLEQIANKDSDIDYINDSTLKESMETTNKLTKRPIHADEETDEHPVSSVDVVQEPSDSKTAPEAIHSVKNEDGTDKLVSTSKLNQENESERSSSVEASKYFEEPISSIDKIKKIFDEELADIMAEEEATKGEGASFYNIFQNKEIGKDHEEGKEVVTKKIVAPSLVGTLRVQKPVGLPNRLVADIFPNNQAIDASRNNQVKGPSRNDLNNNGSSQLPERKRVAVLTEDEENNSLPALLVKEPEGEKHWPQRHNRVAVSLCGFIRGVMNKVRWLLLNEKTVFFSNNSKTSG